MIPFTYFFQVHLLKFNQIFISLPEDNRNYSHNLV
jgi:hypothetical protein